MQGRRIGPFELKAQVARAAGESMWLAERVAGNRSPRWAAIRRLETDVGVDVGVDVGAADGAADPARLELEYRTLRAIDDPRVPRVLGYFPGEGALAVQWRGGASLALARAAHQQGRITLDAATVLDLALDLAMVLRQIQARPGPDGRPFVHGHLQPAVLQVARDGRLAVLGFGRPHLPAPAPAQAPELLAGAPRSPASDRWALGALLIELLGGVPLYSGASPASRMEGRVDPWLQPIAAVNPELGRILARLLALDPSARYLDAGELVAALSKASRSLPGVADRAGLGEALMALQDPRLRVEPEPLAEGAEPDSPPPPAPAPRKTPPPAQVAPRSAAPELPAPSERPAAAPLPEAAAPEAAAQEAVAPAPPDLDPLDLSLEPTEPLDLAATGWGEPPRKPLLRPATSRRLGLGEIAALIAVGVLAVAAVVAWLAR